jgi:hypothetical protein
MNFSLIPLPYKILAAVAVAGVLTTGGFASGYNIRDTAAKADVAEAKLAAEKDKSDFMAANAGLNTQVVTQWRDKVVPIYIEGARNNALADNLADTQEMSNGAVYLYDKSVTGGDADVATVEDSTPSGISLKAAMPTFTDNNTSARACQVQLEKLQMWAKGIEDATAEKPKKKGLFDR